MAALKKKILDLMAAIDRLSRREKFMVGGLTICFVTFVAILVSIWISSHLSKLERRITNKSAFLQELIDKRELYEEAKRNMKRSEERIRRGSNIQLSATLENLAKQVVNKIT